MRNSWCYRDVKMLGFRCPLSVNLKQHNLRRDLRDLRILLFEFLLLEKLSPVRRLLFLPNEVNVVSVFTSQNKVLNVSRYASHGFLESLGLTMAKPLKSREWYGMDFTFLL